MAKSEAVQVAKIQRQIAQDQAIRDVLVSLLSSPLLTFLGSSAGILALQERYGTQSGFGEFFEKGAGLTAAGGIATAQAIAPILPDLLKSGGDVGSLMQGVKLLL